MKKIRILVAVLTLGFAASALFAEGTPATPNTTPAPAADKMEKKAHKKGHKKMMKKDKAAEPAAATPATPK